MPWSAATLVTELSGSGNDQDPDVSGDGLTIYFASDRPVPGYQGYQQAAWLFQQYGKTYPIATQVAIWEVVLDPGNYNLSYGSGSFYVSSLDSGYQSDAQAMLNTLKSQGIDGFNADKYYSVLWSPRGTEPNVHPSDPKDYMVSPQNYMIPTPEPTTILLLGLGLMALGGVKRKFKE
jgi:hypothetical protein